MKGENVRARRWAALLMVVVALAVQAVVAAAQTTTGTIRGTVRDEAGAPIPAAGITAVNTETGFRRSVLARDNGVYALPGLQPGTYHITVTALGRAPESRSLQILIGQALTVDFQLQAQAIAIEGITVTGERALETRTSEIATNVTRQQIESLPQQDRNFLNFAGLAPGIAVSREETNRNIAAGGLPANKINVFIDGASFKNDVLEGGVHGQDHSRGNPFPQIAVREFRVITQNFKAEYQRAASAVVTASTQSGTNLVQVNGFVLGQNKGLVQENPGICAIRLRYGEIDNCPPSPEYQRLQTGLSIGGPLIMDRLHYFVGYEGNYQDREETVAIGPEATPAIRNQLAQYEGTHTQPFRSNLLFGKLSWQPGEEQTLDLSYSGRFESDKRGFGGQNAFTRAEDVQIGYHVVTLQHGFARNNWFNQAHVSAQRSQWNPSPNADEEIGIVYENILSLGSRSTTQDFVQDRLALRNDVTYSGLEWLGTHTLKGGVNVDFLRYEVAKRFDGVPQFYFRPGDLDVPYRAVFGSGDPGMSENNVQFGAFLQTDWSPIPRLELNLGVRWDAETNLFNNQWVTPDSIRQQIGAWAVPDSVRRVVGADFPQAYFTRGREDRPIFLGAFQPRLGFSYDLLGTGSTVLHGGFGVYYDREIWNRLLDERFRLSWIIRHFNFTTNPAEVGGNTLLWRDEYLSLAGIQGIASQGDYGRAGEIFLMHNDTRPSRTHQFNLGLRQTVGDYLLGAAYRGVRGHNIFSWQCVTPHPEHGFCAGFGGFQGVPNNYGILLSNDEGRTWYDALDVTAEKPFTNASPWGFTLTYTLADAHRKGMDFFTLTFPMQAPEDWPRVRSRVERHRVTASGIVALPYDFRVSTLVQLGSGIPFDVRDETGGWGPRRVQTDWAAGEPDRFSQVDLRLQRDFVFPGAGRFGILAEVINLFQAENFREYEGLRAFEGGNQNQRFGDPLWWTADPGRRFQIGLNVGF